MKGGENLSKMYREAALRTELLGPFSWFRGAPRATGVRHSGGDAKFWQYPLVQNEVEDKKAENDKSGMHLE